MCALTSSESEEVVLSFDGPVFFRLILSVELDLAKKRERKKTTLNDDYLNKTIKHQTTNKSPTKEFNIMCVI